MYSRSRDMSKLKYIIVGILALFFTGTGAYMQLAGTAKVTLDTSQSKFIEWDKPTTDEAWAEDTKKENLDFRANEVLSQMIDSHTSKLEREEKALQKFVEMEKAGQDPVQYLYWEKREQLALSYPDMSKQELETEALNSAQTEYNQKVRSVEKLKQSIERMNKEVELRDKGFLVVVEDNSVPSEGIFGASVPANRLRHIHD